MDQTTREVKLKNGWTATLLSFLTQGQFEDIMMEVSGKEGNPRESIPAKYKVLKMVVLKLVSPDGTTYEGDTLTDDVFKSMPYDPNHVAGELTELVNEMSGKKKVTADNSTSS